MAFISVIKQNVKKCIRIFENVTIKNFRKLLLKDKSFSIISNNCWGGFIYQYFGLEYTSPFTGLFIFSKDYLKLLNDLKKYMNMELNFINPEETKYKNELLSFGTYKKYPIGILEDIEIHFLHYEDNKIATEKWERRKRRINYDNLIIKYCDRDLATDDDIKRFSELSYTKKVALTAKKYPYRCCIKLKNEDGEYVMNEWENFIKTVNIIKFINNKKWEW